MNFLEKSRNKLIHLLFPFVERFYIFVPLVVLVAIWSIPQTYWQIRVALFWLWFTIIDIYYAGVMERDYLPVQPGNSLFYHIYRFIARVSFLLPYILLIVLLIPMVPRWLVDAFLGVLVTNVILQAIGDHKYRPKKPAE
jgi:hypothetical protein